MTTLIDTGVAGQVELHGPTDEPTFITTPTGEIRPAVKDRVEEVAVWTPARHGDRYVLRVPDELTFSGLTMNQTNTRFVLAAGNNGHEHTLMPVEVEADGTLCLDENNNPMIGDIGKLTIYEAILMSEFPKEIYSVAERFELDMPREAKFTFFKAEVPVQLRHDEHYDILLPPGCYVAWGQREYGPEAQRMVLD